jgi:hypothetical protein
MEPAFTRLSPDITRAVDLVAASEERSVSATLRLLVKEALKARGAYPDPTEMVAGARR